ncbi:MAG: MAC/perforin domain-containing protein, partial [Bacteroidota bacterium]
KLPLPRGAAGMLAGKHLTAKGEALPASLNSVKTAYLLFLQKYGTHFGKRVAWGGQYVARTQVKRADYEKSRMSKTDFQNEASVTIKKVTVGRRVEFGMGSGESSGRSASAFRRDVFVQGGNGEDDLDKWRDKVDLNPAPVDIEFMASCDLLTAKLFPNDPDIDAKREALRLITEHYILNTYREPKKSKLDFFRPLPDLPMPGNISITNKGGYVMWFKVKYEYKGKWETKETSNYTLGFTKAIEVPIGARNITVTAEHTFGEIFTQTFDKPTTICYKCWGTVFDASYGKCDQ